MTRLSIIIPTLNESKHLPLLLDALERQTRRAEEIIVADAGSGDDTVALARACGARVVPGGMPGPGRNAGARLASGDVFLFLDADVLPRPDFVEKALKEFEQGGYGVATCPTEALSADLRDKIIMEATNLYLQVIIPISPRAPGFCIFARREAHEAVQGFDESLKMSEDHDYVRRASRYGKFGILSSARIPVSMRRLEKEGIVGLALKYLWCELYALAGRPIRSLPFEYEFGAFESKTSARGIPLVDVSELRRLTGRFEGLIRHISQASLTKLQRLIELPLETPLETIRQLLDGIDLETLDRYLQARLTQVKENRFVLFGLSRFKSMPAETIRYLEPAEMGPALPEDAIAEQAEMD